MEKSMGGFAFMMFLSKIKFEKKGKQLLKSVRQNKIKSFTTAIKMSYFPYSMGISRKRDIEKTPQ